MIGECHCCVTADSMTADLQNVSYSNHIADTSPDVFAGEARLPGEGHVG